MIIKFTSQDIKKCQDFANKIDTGFYATRNQFNNEKRIQDQIIGKIAEIVVFSYFKEKGIETTPPDFNIYKKSKKSWDHDIKNQELNLHIKSQSVEQAKKYGTSFVFEKTDKKIFKEYSDKDYVCFVSVDLTNQSAEIKSILKLEDLHKNNLFKPMKLAHLTSKSAVYFDDVKLTFKDNLLAK
jgi:hypothetical protein